MPVHRFTSEGVEYQVRLGLRIVILSSHPVSGQRGSASITMPKEVWEHLKSAEITSPGQQRQRDRDATNDDDDDDDDDDLTEDEIVNVLQHYSTRMPARPAERILHLGPVLVYNEGWREGMRTALKLITADMPCGASINDWSHRVNCDLKRGHDGMHEHAKDTTRKLMWNNAAPSHAETYPVIKRSS